MKHVFWAIFLIGSTASATSGLGVRSDHPNFGHISRSSQLLSNLQSSNGQFVWNLNGQTVGRNYGGLVAETLLSAYETQEAPALLAAASDYANYLVSQHQREPAAKPFKPDIEFLVRMTEVTGNARYAELGRNWFQNISQLSPTEEFRRILAGRGDVLNVTGYDVALGIRAAVAVEAYDYAHGLAEQVIAHESTWLVRANTTFGLISRAALVDALVELDESRYNGAIFKWAQRLTDAQNDNGAWHHNETQTTAYAVRALSKVQDPVAKQAAKDGIRWLRATALPRTRWAHFNDGLPEPFVGELISVIQAEVVAALIEGAKL